MIRSPVDRSRRARPALLFTVLLTACAPTSTAPSATSTVPPSPGPTIGATQTLPTRAPTPIPPPSDPPPSVIPLTGLPEGVLGSPGAIVIATVARHQADWRLNLTVVREGAEPVTGSYRFRVPLGYRPGTDPASVRLAADGWAAISVGGSSALGSGTLVVDLAGGTQLPALLPGSTLAWLPDGSIVMTASTPDGGAVARRIADHGQGEETSVPIEGDCFHVRTELLLEDGSGLFGFRGCGDDAEPVSVLWDGRVIPRDPVATPMLRYGNERLAGARGERAVVDPARTDAVCTFDPCPLDWIRSDGTRLPIPGVPYEFAWTRDGTKLVTYYGVPPAELDGSKLGLVRDSRNGLAFEPLAAGPAGSATSRIDWIEGMSDWAVVGATFHEWGGTVFPLDGSAPIGPFEGTLVLVNP